MGADVFKLFFRKSQFQNFQLARFVVHFWFSEIMLFSAGESLLGSDEGDGG